MLAFGTDTLRYRPWAVLLSVCALLMAGPAGGLKVAPSHVKVRLMENSAMDTGRPIRIFVSHSHRGESDKDRLVTQLRPMGRRGLIAPWDRRQIVPAGEWEPAIDKHLTKVELILLQLSGRCRPIDARRSDGAIARVRGALLGGSGMLLH